MNTFILWDITSCSPLIFNGYFWGKYRLYLQVRRIRQARNHPETGSKQRFGFGLLFDSEIKAKYTSETSVAFQCTTRGYIPEGRTVYAVRVNILQFRRQNTRASWSGGNVLDSYSGGGHLVELPALVIGVACGFPFACANTVILPRHTLQFRTSSRYVFTVQGNNSIACRLTNNLCSSSDGVL